ncbi:MAG: pilus assembly FimT family protein [Patescibacteria group bacterium]
MRQGGFTLIELLVVIAIIGIITSVTMLRADLVQSDAEVDAASRQIVNMAKRARQQSISVAEYRGVFPSYGLHFDMSNPDEFIIYANCLADDNKDDEVDFNDNFAYNTNAHQTCHEEMGSLSLGSSVAAAVETFELKDNAFIYEIEKNIMDTGTSSVSSASVNYLRPEPTVWITTDVGGSEDLMPVGYVKIIIRDKAEEFQEEITFYTSALVETKRVSID